MKNSVAVRIGVALWGACTLALAQSPAVEGVYTCTDAKGRKLTSDRPIPECIDREQRVLNPSGTVKQTVGPTMTAQERAAAELKEKQALEERNRIAEERRRDKALLVRYPNKAVHDKERIEALGQVSAVKQAATTRLTELGSQRAKLLEEMEFYKKDPTKAPLYLRRQLDDNAQSTTVQQRFIAEQDDEARRVNQRFDDELTRLRALWPTISATPK
jgi:hypothetical protein